MTFTKDELIEALKPYVQIVNEANDYRPLANYIISLIKNTDFIVDNIPENPCPICAGVGKEITISTCASCYGTGIDQE